MTGAGPLRVSVLGYGAIGQVVAAGLRDGAVPGARLVGVVNRSPLPDAPGLQISLAQAIAGSDVVVEAAGQEALRSFGPEVVAAGRILVVSSVGALADPEVARRLLAGPGRVLCTHGAVGGLDLLASASDAAPFDGVRVRTTKGPRSLVQSWMPESQQQEILTATGPHLVFAGTPREAARAFPTLLNVAVSVALSVGAGTDVSVELYADRAAELTRHEIEAWGPVGRYSWCIENRPSADNPRTSAVVPYSILRTVSGLTERPPLIA